MVSGAAAGNVLPVILLDREGRVIALTWTNEKGFRKSLENASLWAVDTDTGRLLPYRNGTAISTIVARDGWYEATSAASPAFPERQAGGPEKEMDAAAGGASGAADHTVPTGSTAEEGAVLGALRETVCRRRTELPEGSYTTHLFREGLDKIRKKTGEEAVELILARERGEVVYEAADLIYHLLVLLEASDIPLVDVLRELERRT